jgi:hypothetical protein
LVWQGRESVARLTQRIADGTLVPVSGGLPDAGMITSLLTLLKAAGIYVRCATAREGHTRETGAAGYAMR